MSANKTAIPQGLHVLAKPVGSKCNLDCDYCFYLEQLIVKKSHIVCLFSIILIQCLYDLHLGYFRMTYDLKQRKRYY